MLPADTAAAPPVLSALRVQPSFMLCDFSAFSNQHALTRPAACCRRRPRSHTLFSRAAASLSSPQAAGEYAGFDESEFTCRSGGKTAALRHIKAKWGYSSVVMVGDGATDAEPRADGVADLFVG